MKEAILNHVRASGPVSFGSIKSYVNTQYIIPVEEYEIVDALNELLADEKIKLYDTGDSFVYKGVQ